MNTDEMKLSEINNINDITTSGNYIVKSLKPKGYVCLGEAVIIGHVNYGGVGSLPSVKDDMNKMAIILAKYDYNIAVWYELSVPALEKLLNDWIKNHAKSGTPLFIYFCGHGSSKDTVVLKNDVEIILKNYIFLSGKIDNEFEPFDCSEPNERLNFGQKITDSCSEPDERLDSNQKIMTDSCIVCFDTCLMQISSARGPSALVQEHEIDLLPRYSKSVPESIEETHHKITVFSNANVESTQISYFSLEFELALRRTIRTITNESKPDRQLQVTHASVIKDFIDNGHQFVQTEKRFAIPIFRVNTLSFGKELLKEEKDKLTIEWINHHFRQFITSRNREERRWAWIASFLSMKNIHKVCELVGDIDTALERQELDQLQRLDADIARLETVLSDVPEDVSKYRGHLLSTYRLDVAMCRLEQYTKLSSEQQQATDLERDVRIIADVFQGCGSSLDKLHNDLSYAREIFLGDSASNPGLCRQIIRQVGVAQPIGLPALSPTIYEHTKQILKACDPEQFADDIRLLDHINHYFEELSKSLEQLANDSSQPLSLPAPRIIEIITNTFSFWVIGIFLFLISSTFLSLSINKPELAWFHFHERLWYSQLIVLFGALYVTVRIALYAPRATNRTLAQLLYPINHMPSLVVCILFGALLTFLADNILHSAPFILRICAWLVFLGSGVIVGLLGFHRHE